MELDQLIVLDITVKNTSGESLELTDILDTLDLTDDLEFSRYGDVSDYYDSMEKLSGRIDAGEEISRQMVMDAYERTITLEKTLV